MMIKYKMSLLKPIKIYLKNKNNNLFKQSKLNLLKNKSKK